LGLHLTVVISILRKPRNTGSVLIMLCAQLIAGGVKAQSPVVQFTANYITASSPVTNYSNFPASPGTFSGCNSNNYTYTWSNGSSNQLKLVSFTANSKSYVISNTPGVIVKLRRVDNPNVSGNRNILYCESTFASATACVTSPRQLDFKAPYSDDMTTFLNNNVLNHGTDNIFTNAGNGDGNNNNIERVDVIFTTGVSSALPNDMGFILCERGNNNAHDGFRIAAILSKNAGNDPTSFGAVKTCVAGNGSNNGSWGHPTIANGNRQLAAYVLRKDPAEAYLRVSSNVNQELGGVFFSLTDLGVAANQIIYGYSLIGPDGIANPSSAQLLSTSNTLVYPTTTTEVLGGGLDLIAVNTFFGTNQALAVKMVNNFSGRKEQLDAILNWSLNGMQTGSGIVLQRSTDGLNFSNIHQYNYDGTRLSHFRDQPGTGKFYYRLQLSTGVGSTVMSNIVVLEFSDHENSIKVYPTLAAPGANLSIENIPHGLYMAVLRNSSSAIIFRAVVSARNGRASIRLPGKAIPPGVYYLIFEKDGSPLFGRVRLVVQ
jgi:hypothetical protein